MQTLDVFLLVLLLTFVASTSSKFYTSQSNKTYYIVATETSNWYEAYIDCAFRNMSLLTLDNDEKFQDVHQILSNGKIFPDNDKIRVWIGAIGNDRRFAWINSGLPVVSTLWGLANPSNSAGVENCVEILNTWINDVVCTRKSGFVCEQRSQLHRSGESMAKYNNFTFNLYRG